MKTPQAPQWPPPPRLNPHDPMPLGGSSGGTGLPLAITITLDDVAPEKIELLGISVCISVFERMDGDQRKRAVRYLTDRYMTDQ